MELLNDNKGGGELEPKPTNSVVILDAGAQYGQLIYRQVNNHAVYADILPLDTPVEQLAKYGAIIISGGPSSVYAKDAPEPDWRIWDLGKPILGICYGMQLINQHFGGTVNPKEMRQDGPCQAQISASPLFADLVDSQQSVLMSHGDSLDQIAPGFEVIAVSDDHIVAGIASDEKKIYGVQFHPEVDLTDHGQDMLRNFLFGISNLQPEFTMQNRIEKIKAEIREQVGDKTVLSYVSGGVDSTVLTRLLVEALGPQQVRAVHINNGFMRQDESAAVVKALGEVGLDVDIFDASENFFHATTIIDGSETPPLDQVTDPQSKRQIIGDTFIKMQELIEQELGLDPDRTILAQGTLRTDLIESGSKIVSDKADTIKTHHNDTALARQLRQAGRVLEPLKDLHKDEVRTLGEMLGLPTELVWRQPFPGPGLAIRILCTDRPFVENYDAVTAQLAKFNDEETSAQLLPIKTVGVQGDSRSYSYAVVLSGAENWSKLFGLAREIPKRVQGVNRVVFAFGEHLGQVDKNDITPTFLTPDAIEQLRQVDHIVNKVLRKYGLDQSLSQVPVISFPVSFGEPGRRSIALRPFITNDFMTGRPAVPDEDLPVEVLHDIVKRILADEGLGIARVVLDLTSKPPGTTEWE